MISHLELVFYIFLVANVDILLMRWDRQQATFVTISFKALSLFLPVSKIFTLLVHGESCSSRQLNLDGFNLTTIMMNDELMMNYIEEVRYCNLTYRITLNIQLLHFTKLEYLQPFTKYSRVNF